VDVFVADRFFRLGAHLENSPCVAFGRPYCRCALRCVGVPNLGEAVLKSLPPSQNLFLSILHLVFLPSAPLCGGFRCGSFFLLCALPASLPCVAFRRSSCQLSSVLGAPLANLPCAPSGNPKFFPHRTFVSGPFRFLCWALLLLTLFGFGCPSDRIALLSLWKRQVFSPTAPLSLALWVLLVGRSSWRLASVLGAPLADSPCVISGNPKFSPHHTSIPGSLDFVGWSLLLATLLSFGCPSGRIALRSLWKPQVFFPPHLCRWLFRFCWLGPPLGDLPRILGAPLADLPCAPSGNPKFSPHRTFVAGSSGFFGWALLFATRLHVGRPSGRLALRSLWKPQVFSPPHLCHRLFGFCWLGAPLGDSASVLGAPLAESPCVLSRNPKFSSHRTSIAGSLGFVCWALLLATRLGVGRPSGRLAMRSLWKPQVFFSPHLCRRLFGFCWLGAPLGHTP
jgi:hypothetical protein